jgi:hypothetical protein
MNKIDDYDPFILIFSCFSWSAGQAPKKKLQFQKLAIFEREIFLNIEKNRNRLAIKGAKIKGNGI